MDVGDLRQGTRSLQVWKPKYSEAFPEATVREGADGLTLRADEVGTQRAFTNADHIIAAGRTDWHALYQAIHKGRMGGAVLSLQRNEQGDRS